MLYKIHHARIIDEIKINCTMSNRNCEYNSPQFELRVAAIVESDSASHHKLHEIENDLMSGGVTVLSCDN